MAITSNTVDPFNAKTIRALMGSILQLPLVHIRILMVIVLVTHSVYVATWYEYVCLECYKEQTWRFITSYN